MVWYDFIPVRTQAFLRLWRAMVAVSIVGEAGYVHLHPTFYFISYMQ